MAKNVHGQSFLPEDLVIEILAYTAVKPLLRLRCVSKSWNSLIRSRMFIGIHLRKNRQTKNNDQPDLLLLKHLRQEATVFSFHDVNSPRLLELRVSCLGNDGRTRLLGPCNGLVLLVEEIWAHIYICNPALRERKLLPPCPFSDHRTAINHDHNYYTTAWGFGSALCTYDFNVVKLQCLSSLNNNGNRVISTKAHVYSSNTNSWRKINDICTVAIPSVSYNWSEVFLNGICHWHAFCPSHESYSYSILTFDLSTEIFKQLDYPKHFWGLGIGTHSPTKLNECLAAIVWRQCDITSLYLYEVWVMREYGVMESWTKQCVIGPHIYLRPLSFWKNEEWLLAESKDGHLISCSLRDNEIKRFQIHGITLRAVIYKESLISLN